MAYYCGFDHDGESAAASRVLMNPNTGDVVSACDAHALTLGIGMITDIIGESNMAPFLTDWLESVLPKSVVAAAEADLPRPTKKAAGSRKAAARKATAPTDPVDPSSMVA